MAKKQLVRVKESAQVKDIKRQLRAGWSSVRIAMDQVERLQRKAERLGVDWMRLRP